MTKPNYYNEYKKSELYKVISNSEFTEDTYNELKQELESTYAEISKDPEQRQNGLVDGAEAMLRYAIKHLCRKYPTFGVCQYRVIAETHKGDAYVSHIVDATHEEQAKFYFHTHYDHRRYRVTSVVKLDTKAVA